MPSPLRTQRDAAVKESAVCDFWLHTLCDTVIRRQGSSGVSLLPKDLSQSCAAELACRTLCALLVVIAVASGSAKPVWASCTLGPIWPSVPASAAAATSVCVSCFLLLASCLSRSFCARLSSSSALAHALLFLLLLSYPSLLLFCSSIGVALAPE